jgi:hypothetical protein
MDMWSFACVLHYIIMKQGLFITEKNPEITPQGLINPDMIREQLSCISSLLSRESFVKLYEFVQLKESQGKTVRSFHQGISLKDFRVDDQELKRHEGIKKASELLFRRLQRVRPQEDEDMTICYTICRIFEGCLNTNPYERMTAFKALTIWNRAIGKQPPNPGKEPLRL